MTHKDTFDNNDTHLCNLCKLDIPPAMKDQQSIFYCATCKTWYTAHRYCLSREPTPNVTCFTCHAQD